MNSTIVYESGTYTATIWYKHLSGDLPYLFKHSDINIEGGSVVTPFIEGEGWQRVDVTFTIPEGYTSQFYHLRYAQSSPPEHLDGETLIGAIKIIKGTKATTDWTEAPEDLDSNINNIDSRLVSAESSITQNAEAIESRVSITDYTTDQNNIISRLDSAETSITQNADSIESRVTVTQFTDGLARKGNVYRAVARAWNGGGSNRYPTPSGLYDEEGDLIPYEPSGNDRSFILYVMNRSKEEWIFAKRYDVWSSSDEASNLADDLSSYDENYLIVLIACHSPEQNKNTGGLPEQIYRCGGSESVYMSDGWGGSASYILIGIPNMGEGAGLEHFRKARSSDTYGGWLDITFNIKDGTVDFGDSRGYVASNRINVAESLITQNADAIQLRVTEEHFGNVINNLETDINQRAREYRINFPFSSSRDYVILLCRSNLTGASNFAVGTLTGRRVSGHYSSGEVKVVFNNSSDGSRASGYHEAIDVHYTDSWSMVTCTYNGQSYVGLRHNTGNDFGLWNTDCRFYGQIGSSSEMLLPVETSNLTNVQTFNSVGGVSSLFKSRITNYAISQ
ncbi:hypothetical protein [Halalkalibacter hemicellulosilyticus]|uniref:Uncharacterized protein n=1 Tax=Halalkalibacter hemicellulosilyticusJCM 9152 TaxID=1236971 RepID=W4QJX9_9BACI|nr:hypothetical protein [Halalkalibacter hemicellulosilyticus]GAE31928.1 hypothetical protein JCM9152_3428 [Halalkalibacter hemicellulosilyticusJCM 9152]